MRQIFETREMTCFTLYSFFGSLVFETPIFAVFLMSKGINYSQMAMLFAIYALSTFVFEYITGVLADQYSRKQTLVVSLVSIIFGELCFILGNHLSILTVGMVFVALSTAARSGADTALLYDKLLEQKREGDFNKIISTLGSSMLILTALSCVIGPVLASVNMVYPFWMTILFSLAALMAILRFEEAQGCKETLKAKMIIKSSIKFSFNHKTLLRYMALSVLIFPCYHFIDQFFQPYMKLSGIKIEYFGVFYTVMALVQSLGTIISGHFSEKINLEKSLFLSAYLILFGFAIMVIPRNYMVYGVPIIMGFGFGVYYNLNTILMNGCIPSPIRASVLSFQHAMTKISQVIIFAAISAFMHEGSLRSLFAVVATVMMLLTTAVYFLMKKNLNESAIEDVVESS